jgi:hypothetical protein
MAFRVPFIHCVPFVLGLALMIGSGCAGDPEPSEDAESEDDLVATFDKRGDVSKPTRVLLVGDSDKLGNLPLWAATSRARRYAQLYPNEQVVLFITKDVKEAEVARTGSTVVSNEPFGEAVKVSDLARLSNDKLLAALDRFKSISSLDFFGHSSPFGILLEAEGDNRVVNAKAPSGTAKLADNFNRNGAAYVTLNGCNGGVELAAELSRLWQVPASGALTGSNFEELMSDGKFYVNDPLFVPEGLNKAATNAQSYVGEAPRCSSGACIRMRPQDTVYRGVWSNPDTGMQYGLPFYKFFCNYDDPNKTCQRGMIASLYAFQSSRAIDARSSVSDVREVLADFICSRGKDAARFERCRQDLFQAVDTNGSFSALRGRVDYSLECDFKGCQQQFRCTRVNGVPQKKTCAWVAPGCPENATKPNAPGCEVKNTAPKTAVNEFRAYLEGHALMQNAPTPATVKCLSSTLARQVDENTCVQSKRDQKWYRCEASGWAANNGNSGCTQRFPLQ